MPAAAENVHTRTGEDRLYWEKNEGKVQRVKTVKAIVLSIRAMEKILRKKRLSIPALERTLGKKVT